MRSCCAARYSASACATRASARPRRCHWSQRNTVWRSPACHCQRVGADALVDVDDGDLRRRAPGAPSTACRKVPLPSRSMVSIEPAAPICGNSAPRACGFASSAARRRWSASWMNGSLRVACSYTCSRSAECAAGPHRATQTAQAIITGLVRIGTLADGGIAPRSLLQNCCRRHAIAGAERLAAKEYQQAGGFRIRRILMAYIWTGDFRHTPAPNGAAGVAAQ